MGMHARRVEPFLLWIDGLIISCHDGPRWNSLPRRDRLDLTKHGARQGSLNDRHDECFRIRDILAEDVVEFHAIHPPVTSLVLSLGAFGGPVAFAWLDAHLLARRRAWAIWVTTILWLIPWEVLWIFI